MPGWGGGRNVESSLMGNLGRERGGGGGGVGKTCPNKFVKVEGGWGDDGWGGCSGS